MRPTPTHHLALGFAIIAAALPMGVPGAALARSGNATITLSAPGPIQMLDQARQSLAAGRIPEATASIEQAQHRLLVDSTARNRPASADVGQMRDAVVLLDQARQALTRGDTGRAATMVSSARALL